MIIKKVNVLLEKAGDIELKALETPITPRYLARLINDNEFPSYFDRAMVEHYGLDKIICYKKKYVGKPKEKKERISLWYWASMISLDLEHGGRQFIIEFPADFYMTMGDYYAILIARRKYIENYNSGLDLKNQLCEICCAEKRQGCQCQKEYLNKECND